MSLRPILPYGIKVLRTIRDIKVRRTVLTQIHTKRSDQTHSVIHVRRTEKSPHQCDAPV